MQQLHRAQNHFLFMLVFVFTVISQKFRHSPIEKRFEQIGAVWQCLDQNVHG